MSDHSTDPSGDFGDGRSDSVEALLSLAVDGDASPEQLKSLNDILRGSPEARQQAMRLLQQEALLEFELPMHDAPQRDPRIEFSFQQPAVPAPRANGVGNNSRTAWIAAVAVAVIVVLGVVMTRERADEPPGPVTLATDFHSDFAQGYAPADGIFPPGEYRLTSGAVVLKFPRVVTVAVESPATFSVESTSSIHVASGRVRARVSPRGAGFVVSTPQGNVVDRGTEFGVAVHSDGQSEIHVFEGKVELHAAGNREMLQRVGEGSAVAWEGGKVRDLPASDPDAFPDPDNLGSSARRRNARDLLNDPALVAYYEFEPVAGHPTRLHDQSDAANHGTIRGATWDSGRWPGKGALLFEGGGDAVALDPPFDSASATVACWIKVDRFEFPLTAILNRDGHERGGLHHQFDDNGVIRTGVGHLIDPTNPQRRDIRVGVWEHVVIVLDEADQTLRYYVNGREVAQTDYRPDGPLKIGPAHIGFWAKPVRDSAAAHRGLHGRIDELVLLRRPLDKVEIREMYQAGNPY